MAKRLRLDIVTLVTKDATDVPNPARLLMVIVVTRHVQIVSLRDCNSSLTRVSQLESFYPDGLDRPMN